MTAAVVALAVAVGLLGLLVVGLLRSHADILRALHDLGVRLDDDAPPTASGPNIRTVMGVPEPGTANGSVADIVGVSPIGDAMAVGVAGAPHRTLLAFLSSGCLTCQHFWKTFADPEAIDLPDDIRLVIVAKGPEHDSPSLLADLAPTGLPTVMTDSAWDAYDVPVSPYFVLVDGPSGAILGEGASAQWSQVRNLMVNAVRDQESLGLTAASRRPDPDADAALQDAGIEPGDTRLFHAPEGSPDA